MYKIKINKVVNCLFLLALINFLNLRRFQIPTIMVVSILWTQFLNFYDYYSHKTYYNVFKSINGFKLWIWPIIENQLWLLVIISIFSMNLMLIIKSYIISTILILIAIFMVNVLSKINYIMCMIYFFIMNIVLIFLKVEWISIYFWIFKYWSDNNELISIVSFILSFSWLIFSLFTLFKVGKFRWKF